MSELHKDQWQERNPKTSDALFGILAKAFSGMVLQVSHSCVRERAHLVVGVFW